MVLTTLSWISAEIQEGEFGRISTATGFLLGARAPHVVLKLGLAETYLVLS